MKKISAVLIVYNESANLRRSLAQLWWCDEVVVVDSFSTDDSVDICRRYGCKVAQRRFDGYGAQKQYAISLAKNDWILSLDADEVLSDALIDEITHEMRNPAANGYMLPLTFVFMGKPMRFGKESRRPLLRLFNKQYGGFDASLLHEKVHCSGAIKKMRHPFYHYSHRSVSHFFEKLNKYSSLGATVYYEKGKRRARTLIVLSVPLYFIKYYLLELNFLNGITGFYWSLLISFEHFVKYIKTEELYSAQTNNFLELGIPHAPRQNEPARRVAATETNSAAFQQAGS
jgi:glycosyltransferase involved in cell wall biosynthesis